MPSFPIPLLVSTQVAFGIILGILTGLLELGHKPFFLIFGKSLLGSTIILFLVCGFFYYLYHLFYGITLNFHRLMGIVVFSSLPFLFFRIGVVYISLLHLVGLAFSSVLFSIGIIENFKLPKKQTLRLIMILFAVYSVSWFIALAFEVPSTYESHPKDLDVIEKNLKK